MRSTLAILLIFVASHCFAVTPSAAEMDDQRRWAAAKFEGVVAAPTTQACLVVVENHDVVQIDARAGEPLRIGAKTYRRGLYCHAPSKVIVRLPRAGKVFHSEIGADARAGGGSIVFMVNAGGKNLFKSEVMQIDQPAKAIDVPLDGAIEFELVVTDAGDGITSDQANWADARVTLDDGSEIELGDLPMADGKPEVVSTDPLFSFTYGGKSSRDLLATWKCDRASVAREGLREHSITHQEPNGLNVRCAGVQHDDSPTVEWTLHFKNTGEKDSPLIENIRAVDVAFASSKDEPRTFHYNRGDDCTPLSYEPLAEAMPAGFAKQITAVAGRPTQVVFPYFNFARAARGEIVVIGWPGQWTCDLRRDSDGALHVSGGQELTRFRLKPGEEVRSPRVVVQFYRGDWIRGQNLWRRWMVRHNMPRPDGKPVPPMRSLCTGNFYPGLMSNTKQEITFLKQHLDAGVKFETWWQDAGWYPCDGVTWPKTGTWEVDRKRYPNGLREISDFAHKNGVKSMVWFEPERVHADTWLAEKHPEWIHGGKAGGLLKLDNPECRAWVIEKIDQLLREEKIDLYRQDFNIDPLSYWRSEEAEDRQGMTEIRHVEGYLAFWDELLKRHPGMFIDSCASGGRRNDIETLRRAVPLLRSDWYHGEDGQQCHTYGLSLWFPYQGTGAIYPRDQYWFISSMVANLTFGPQAAGVTDGDLKTARAMTELHQKMGDCFLGDFYPLTPYAQSAEVWMAWQYHVDDGERGVVQAFRRSNSIYESAALPLNGLSRSATYEITDLLTNEMRQMSGSDLMTKGLHVALPQRSSAAVIAYRRTKSD